MSERAVVVVGGGVIGSSVALHLREALPSARVVVVERDPTYARASSRLATGGVRQQYCSPLNVGLARHSVAFYATMDRRLEAIGHPGRIRFRQRGYLFLADAASGDALDARFDLLCRSGARVERLTVAQVQARVPGIRCDDLQFGVLGPEDGYLEPREVLSGMRALAVHAGAEYATAEVVGIERAGGRATAVVARDARGEDRRIDADAIVVAAGAWSAGVGALAGVALPIRPVRQHLFRVELGAPLPTRIPMIFDPDGTHWRLDDDPGRAGDRLVVGRSRPEEPAGENFACDHARYTREMMPTLLRRYTPARVGEVVEAWTGLYEMTPDHNGLLGELPTIPGLVVAAGFSGHGLMLAPATGRAVAELVAYGESRSFDVGRLRPDRFERGEPFVDGALI